MYPIAQIRHLANQEAKANPKLANDIMESAHIALNMIAEGKTPKSELELFQARIAQLKEET